MYSTHLQNKSIFILYERRCPAKIFLFNLYSLVLNLLISLSKVLLRVGFIFFVTTSWCFLHPFVCQDRFKQFHISYSSYNRTISVALVNTVIRKHGFMLSIYNSLQKRGGLVTCQFWHVTNGRVFFFFFKKKG